MNVRQVGSFIRDQRTAAKLSLRKMATLAGVSIPYLSQVERGLRKPSAEILQAIAKALRISAETLYVEAGILEERPASDVSSAIRADPGLTAAHKQALLQIYEAFREEGRRSEPDAGVPRTVPSTPRRRGSRRPAGPSASSDPSTTES